MALKYALLRRKGVLAKVGEAELCFYPVSPGILFEMNTSLKPLAEALVSLFKPARNDVGQTVSQGIDPETGQPASVTRIDPINPDLAKLRGTRDDQAIGSAVDALLSEHSKQALGRILMDSLRDDFPRHPTPEDINGFVDELDLGMVLEMASGFVKANTSVFGPLGLKLATIAREKIGAVASEASAASETAAA